MTNRTVVIRDSLPNPVDLRINHKDLDFTRARLMADQKAMDTLTDPMLLSWYDAKKGRFSPDVVCCSEEKPGWIVYAESRGGNLSIDINDEEFVFIYRDLATSGGMVDGRRNNATDKKNLSTD